MLRVLHEKTVAVFHFIFHFLIPFSLAAVCRKTFPSFLFSYTLCSADYNGFNNQNDVHFCSLPLARPSLSQHAYVDSYILVYSRAKLE